MPRDIHKTIWLGRLARAIFVLRGMFQTPDPELFSKFPTDLNSKLSIEGGNRLGKVVDFAFYSPR